MQPDERTLLEADGRRRISLDALEPHNYLYLALFEQDGTVVLQPATVMSVALHRQIQESIDNPQTRVRRGRPVRHAAA